jgi:hypothetical protein
VLARPGHSPFSVPWSELAASRDEWPWFPFTGEPMIRLTIAAYPNHRILVPMRDGRRISEASGDKLTIDGVGAAPATARRW